MILASALAGPALVAPALAACSNGSDRTSGSGDTAATSSPATGADPVAGDRRLREFCIRVADSVSEAFGLAAVGAPSPDSMRVRFELAGTHAEAAIAVAPDEIRPDLVVLTNAVAGLRESLAAVNYDVAAAAGAGSAFSTPEVEQATARTLAYVEQHCGTTGRRSARQSPR